MLQTFNSMSWSIHASVQKHQTIIHQTLSSFAKLNSGKTELKNPSSFVRACNSKDKIPCYDINTVSHHHRTWSVTCMANSDPNELSDEDEELCPVECVREIKKDEELQSVIEKAKKGNSLVVVDFYRTSCGSCKYIEQGFAKLCRGLGDEEAPVIFLKHNVLDEYDEQSEIAERLRIKSVPLFHFYKNGILLEAFATRDKVRIKEAIEKYTASASAAAQNA